MAHVNAASGSKRGVLDASAATSQTLPANIEILSAPQEASPSMNPGDLTDSFAGTRASSDISQGDDTDLHVTKRTTARGIRLTCDNTLQIADAADVADVAATVREHDQHASVPVPFITFEDDHGAQANVDLQNLPGPQAEAVPEATESDYRVTSEAAVPQVAVSDDETLDPRRSTPETSGSVSNTMPLVASGIGPSRDADALHHDEAEDAEECGSSQNDEQSGNAQTDGKGRECTPKPFARRLRLHIDACAGTNKSQYCFGGLALLVSLGILDVVWISFMVPGHTKFAPDLVARAIAGVYNRVDVFNIGMLLECAQRCSSAQSYDAHSMYHWKECTKQLFGSVDNIMSYRQFFILPEHEALDLGESVPLPPNMEPFPGGRAPLRRDDVLQAASKAVYADSMKRIARECIESKYLAGVGAGALENGPTRLHPSSVNSFLRVRLFMRRNESEPVWREQTDWMHPSISLQTFNDSLQRLRPYSETPDAGREHYGKKLSGIREQYTKYVPSMFVPDDVELSSGGMTTGMGIGGGTRQTFMEEHISRAAATSTVPIATSGSATQIRDVRWSSAAHTPVLRAILMREFAGSVPNSSTDVKKLVSLMQQDSPAPLGFAWDGGKLRKRARDILKQNSVV